MTLTNILNNLSQLSETELRTLNRAACNQLKANRNAESARKRDLFSPGDHVQWNGRMGHTVGVIIRIKRKKAIVEVGGFQNWDVPLAMLSAVV